MTEENRSEEEKKEIGLYEKLAARSKEFVGEAREKTSEAVGAAIVKSWLYVQRSLSGRRGKRHRRR
jgi:hypothetical protein